LRHARAFRDIFQLVREALLSANDIPTRDNADTGALHNPGADA
jgi:hypothetical protein